MYSPQTPKACSPDVSDKPTGGLSVRGWASTKGTQASAVPVAAGFTQARALPAGTRLAHGLETMSTVTSVPVQMGGSADTDRRARIAKVMARKSSRYRRRTERTVHVGRRTMVASNIQRCLRAGATSGVSAAMSSGPAAAIATKARVLATMVGSRRTGARLPRTAGLNACQYFRSDESPTQAVLVAKSHRLSRVDHHTSQAESTTLGPPVDQLGVLTIHGRENVNGMRGPTPALTETTFQSRVLAAAPPCSTCALLSFTVCNGCANHR